MKFRLTPILLSIIFLIGIALPVALSEKHPVIANEERHEMGAIVANANLELEPTCGIRPDPNPTVASNKVGPSVSQPAPLFRFRRPMAWQNSSAAAASPAGYTPMEYQAIANPTNYGQRYIYDINGQPTNHVPIVVLHETAATSQSTISFFQTPHSSEDNQASYHTLITLNGDIVYIVPPDLRAFGAGNSVFVGSRGTEAVKTHPNYPPSVNNFAYHVSLETPPDGLGGGSGHSGYTMPQYQSLAWLVSKTGVPRDRITTHAAVDRSGERSDPRSFDRELFYRLLSQYPQTLEIVIGCQAPGRRG